MIDGRIEHEGSLEHGQTLQANQVQAQRAGGDGFKHNEINPDNEKNRMLQLWVLPETEGESADYKFYDLEHGKLTRIYGGTKIQNITLDSHTIIKAGIFNTGQKVSGEEEFIAYICRGKGVINAENIKDGDLIRGEKLDFTATTDDVLIFIVTILNL